MTGYTNDLGAVKAVVEPAIHKNARTYSQMIYAVQVAVNNVNNAVGSALVTLLPKLGKLFIYIPIILNEPNSRDIQETIVLLQRAIYIQRSMLNVNTQLGDILKSALEDGSKCMRNLGSSISTSVVILTGALPESVNGQDTATILHLLDHELRIATKSALDQFNNCFTAKKEIAKNALNAIQPATQRPILVAPVTKDVAYIQFVVPATLNTLLNIVLNGNGNVFKGVLDNAWKTISDTRYRMAQVVSEFRKPYEFAVIQIAQMTNGFDILNHDVLNKIVNTFDDMHKFITNLAENAAALLLGVLPAKSQEIIAIISSAIQNAANCVEKMGNYVKEAVSSAHTLGGTIIQLAHDATSLNPANQAVVVRKTFIIC